MEKTKTNEIKGLLLSLAIALVLSIPASIYAADANQETKAAVVAQVDAEETASENVKVASAKPSQDVTIADESTPEAGLPQSTVGDTHNGLWRACLILLSVAGVVVGVGLDVAKKRKEDL